MATYTRPDATYPAIAEDGGRTSMSPADVGAGWSTSSQTRPPAATFNARDYLTSSAIKYLCRLGIAEYSPAESYQGYGLCIGSNGSVYWNLIACQGIDPVNNVSGNWEKTAIRRADCAELIGNVTGGTIPETLNLLKGNGTGSAADSGITDDGTTVNFPTNVTAVGTITAGAAVSIGVRGSGIPWQTGVANINSDGTNVVFNPAHGAFAIYLSYDQGTGGVKFGNGAQGVVGTVDSVGNATFNGTLTAGKGNLRIGDRATGGPWTSGSPNINSDGNALLLNGVGAAGIIYFNWDDGTGGAVFGNGAGQKAVSISSAGFVDIVGGLNAAGIWSGAGTSANIGGGWTSTHGPGLTIAWNLSAGAGETDFINVGNTAPGGFSWFSVASGGSLAPANNVLMSLSGTGSLFVRQAGSFTTAVGIGPHQGAQNQFYIDLPDGNTTRIQSVSATPAMAGSFSIVGYSIDYQRGLEYIHLYDDGSTYRIALNGAVGINGALNVPAGITTGAVAVGGQSPAFSLTDDGATSFLDGAGSGGRLYLNYNRPGGLVDLSGQVKIEICQKTYAALTQRDVTASRALGTWYQNTTGMSIQVSMTAHTTGGSVGQLLAYCGTSNGGSPLVWMNENTASVAGAEVACAFMVPPGWFYAVSGGGNLSGAGIGRWFEWTCP
jgi:hypothetical protein